MYYSNHGNRWSSTKFILSNKKKSIKIIVKNILVWRKNTNGNSNK